MTSHRIQRTVSAVGLLFALIALVPRPVPAQMPAAADGFCGSSVTAAEAQRFLERSREPQPAPMDTPPP